MKIPVPCLSCGKALHQVLIAGVEVEACVEGCGGIWFDASELQRFNSEGESSEDPVLARLLQLPPQERKIGGKRICVKCGEKMKEHEYRRNSGIFIDECYSCGGIWLDGGELKAIRNSLAVRESDQDRLDEEKRNSEKLVQARLQPAPPSHLSKALKALFTRSYRLF